MSTTKRIQIAGASAAALALALACAGCGNAAPTASTPAATTSATTTAAATRAEPPAAVTEEQKVPETPVAQSTQSDSNVVDGGSFTVDIPSYWQGRVQWSVSDGKVKICPNDMPDYALIEIEQMSEPAMEAGDIGTSLIGDVQLGTNSYAEAWIKRWAFFATQPESTIASVMGSSSPQTIAGLDVLVDLQTGGAMSYADLASNPNISGQDLLSRSDEFLTNEVVPTIKAK